VIFLSSTLVTLEYARNLLQHTNNSVQSTAIQCGFHDAKHLRRLWKKHFGTTPSATRLQPSDKKGDLK
jgi:transcriptional regulator GlxA family with amidase domain